MLYTYDAIDRQGATPFIAFKSNHTGRGSRLWKKMFLQFCGEDFLASYHKRSNVESTLPQHLHGCSGGA